MPLLCLKLSNDSPLLSEQKLKSLQWMAYKVLHILPPTSSPRAHYFFDIDFIFLSLAYCFSHTGHLAILGTCQGSSCLRTFVVLFSRPGMLLHLISAWHSPRPPSGPCSKATFSVKLLWPFYLKLTFFFTLFYSTALATI